MVKVAFLGPRGTYTHQAVIQEFGENIEIYPQPTIDQCFEILNSGDVDYSIVPFENSTNGQVIFTYDLIRDWYFQNNEPKFKIVGEQFVSIHHNLLSKELDINNITKIYSHPQVWGQVTGFLKNLDKKVIKLDTNSTSKAAEIVSLSNEENIACISSSMCSKLYNLPIIQHNIEDNKYNTTRFLILGNQCLKERPSETKNYITSIIFTMKEDHDRKSGSLCSILMEFQKHDINLITINSRPSKQRNWHYAFFVEIEGHMKDEKVVEGLKELKDKCEEIVTLGSFERRH